jgi:predicted ATP-binding protein involved in virulence
MKIKKLVVKNYKVFDHLELDFTDKNGQVLDTIVLAGLNGSGKTTVLELLRDLIDGNIPPYLKIDSEFRLEILFEKRNYIDSGSPEYIRKKEIYLSIQSYSDEYDILVFEYKKDKNSVTDFASLNSAIHGVYQNIAHYHTIHKKPQISQAVYFYSNDKQKNNADERKNITEATFTAHNQFIRQSILDLIKEQALTNIDTAPRQTYAQNVKNLNEVFKNLNIKSKLIQADGKNLIFESINGDEIGFDNLASGEKKLYFMGFTLNQLNLKDALIMVDEPEDSLHPKWQQQIVRFFNNIGSNNQVILATHSPQIIASVHPESLFVLAINDETNKVEAVNMADEHKYTYGVDPNRILSEIMGTPIRDFETQQRIKAISDLIKHVEFNPSVSGVSQVEKEINLLTEDLGKQDASIMRFRNEILLLKRKLLVAQ